MLHSIVSVVALVSLSSGSRRLLDSTMWLPAALPAQSGGPPPPRPFLIPTGAPTRAPDVTRRAAGIVGGANAVLSALGTLPPLPTGTGQGGGPQAEMQCVLNYEQVGSCANQRQTIRNAAENFKMGCSAVGACAQSTISLFYASGGIVKSINGIEFSEALAGWGTTIEIVNQQGGNIVKLENLACKVPTACLDLTVILTNADVGDIDCSYPENCENCFIKVGPLDPNPMPCFGW